MLDADFQYKYVEECCYNTHTNDKFNPYQVCHHIKKRIKNDMLYSIYIFQSIIIPSVQQLFVNLARNSMHPSLPSLSKISPPNSSEWSTIYARIKTDGNYKAIQANIESYANKITNILIEGHSQQPYLTIKKTDHRMLLNELHMNNLKMVDQIAMLNLNDLASSLQYAFQQMNQCLGVLFDHLESAVYRLADETGNNHTRYVYTSKCTQCQNNLMRAKIQNMMTSMTLGHSKKRNLQKINNEIESIGQSKRDEYQEAQLSSMIEEALQRKQSILGSKNSRINTIYQQIGQYLQNMPQTSLNMFKQQNSRNSSQLPGLNEEVNPYFNFSQQFEKSMGEMLKNPVKRLIGRIIDQTKSKYCKDVQFCQVSTQTLLIKDEQNIKMLLKGNENLKKQVQILRKGRREAEKDLTRAIQTQQNNQIKIKQLTINNQFLNQKLDRLNAQMTTTKQKLDQTQKNSEKSLRDYHHEKLQFLRCIREYEQKVQSTSFELTRLRKQTQGLMVSQCIGTDQLMLFNVESQYDENMSDIEIRSTNHNFHSKKNIYIKVGRKSITNHNHENNTKDVIIQKSTQETDDNNVKKKKALQAGGPVSRPKERNQKNKQKKEQIEDNNITNNQIVRTQKKQKSIIGYQNQQNRKNSKHYKFSHLEGDQDSNQMNENLDTYEKQMFRSSYIDLNKAHCKQEQYPGGKHNISMMMIEGRNDKLNTISHFNIRPVDKDRDQSSRNISFRQQIKNDKLNHSSRMFLSKQHCSPYIWGQIGNVSQADFQNNKLWLDVVQMNNSRRVTKVLHEAQKVQSQAKDLEKMQFLSQIMQQYSRLKQNGLLVKINQIINSTDSSQINTNNCLMSHQRLQPKIEKVMQPEFKVNRLKTTGQNQRIIKTLSKKKATRDFKVHISQKIQIMNQKPRTYFQHLTVAQLDLLFISLQNARKYQANVQIWPTLQNSIMIDYHFMSFCDNAQVFLEYLHKNVNSTYFHLSQFLQFPIKYLEKKGLLKQHRLKTSQRLKQRKKAFHSSLNPGEIQSKSVSISLIKSQSPTQLNKQNDTPIQTGENQSEVLSNPHELRDIIHKLLKFHKVVHRKCSHVEEFLNIFGFDRKKIEKKAEQSRAYLIEF